MYPIISANFPFVDIPATVKARPVLCLTEPQGVHRLVVVAYMTTNNGEQLPTDVLLQKSEESFAQTGLKHDTTIKLHKLTTISVQHINGQVGNLHTSQVQQVQQILRRILKLQ